MVSECLNVYIYPCHGMLFSHLFGVSSVIYTIINSSVIHVLSYKKPGSSPNIISFIALRDFDKF